MEPDDVESEFGEPPGHFFSMLMRTEVHAAVEERAEKTGGRPVLEDQLVILDDDKTVPPGRLLVLKHVGDVDGRVVPFEDIRDKT